MSDYLENVVLPHARIIVLRLLADMPEYTSNDSALTDGVRAFSIRLSRDQVAAQLAWLAEQGLVRIDDLGAIKEVVLTDRGRDVAAGTAIVPGVKRPGPR
jgi:hypothetical protein